MIRIRYMPYCLLVSALISFRMEAQVYYYDEAPYADSAEARSFYLAALRTRDSFYQSGFRTEIFEIFEMDSARYMTIDGRLNLFAWQTDGWSNISQSKYHGYNHHSRKYKFNNTLYSYGGYGFWRQHGDLIQYVWDRNEWETVPLQTQKDPGTNATFSSGNFLYVIHPESRNQHLNHVSKHEGMLRIDLITGEIEKFNTHPLLDQLESKLRLETQNYFLVSRDPFQIIDKRNLKCKFSDITYALELSQQSVGSFIWIRGDSVSVLTQEQATDFISTNLATIYVHAPFDEIPLIRGSNYLMVSAFSILILMTGYLYYKRKKRMSRIIRFSHPMIEKVLKLSGKSLTQEELDEVFEIQHITPAETQRSKRSNLYNEINNEYEKTIGVKLINRIPDPLDKRKFLYQIKEISQ